jgi:hypothetical protein
MTDSSNQFNLNQKYVNRTVSRIHQKTFSLKFCKGFPRGSTVNQKKKTEKFQFFAK